MPAAAIGAVATVAAGAISANAQSKAASKAADAQTQASEAAIQFQREALSYGSQLSLPQLRAGAAAQARQMLMAGISPNEVRDFLRDTLAIRPYGGNGADTAATRAPTNGAGRARFGDFFNAPGFGSEGPSAITAPQTSTAAPVANGADDLSWIDTYDPETFIRETPGYQFRLGEGNRAIERSAAARGRLFSGATGRALTRYNQDYASNEWDNEFNRLGAIAGNGQTANTQLNQNQQNFANNAGNLTTRAGDARATSYLQSGNAWANFFGNTLPGAIGYGSGLWGGNKGYYG